MFILYQKRQFIYLNKVNSPGIHQCFSLILSHDVSSDNNYTLRHKMALRFTFWENFILF